MIIDQLKKENILALKNKDYHARVAYSLAIDRYHNLSIEAKAEGREIGDLEMIQIVTKILKELDFESQEYRQAGNEDKAKDINYQSEVLKPYLPKFLSEDEIRQEINSLSDQSIPNVMKHFKTTFAGKVDLSLVNKVLKSL